MAILDTVAEALPHYPLDAAFEVEIPAELREHYARWSARRGSHPPPGRSW